MVRKAPSVMPDLPARAGLMGGRSADALKVSRSGTSLLQGVPVQPELSMGACVWPYHDLSWSLCSCPLIRPESRAL